MDPYSYIPSAQLDRNLVCGICRNVLSYPHQLKSCTHVFCLICIKELAEKTEVNGEGKIAIPCPECRTPFNPESVIEVPILSRIIANLTFTCPNDCGEVVTYSSINRHRQQCALQPVTCPNYRCPAEPRRHGLKEHLERCIFTVKYCQYCGVGLLLLNHQIHETKCEIDSDSE